MDYKERYEEALDRARKLQENSNGMILKKWLWNVFPELKESEDEKIRREITELVMQPTWKTEKEFHRRKEIVTWLEKQGEQKLPIEKFHEGEWVVFNDKHESVYQIEKIENFQYTLRHILGGSMPLSFSDEDMIRLWTIQDAKNGDALVTYDIQGNIEWLFLYMPNKHKLRINDPRFYCHYDLKSDSFKKDNDYVSVALGTKFCPATKEQRDTLFAKMKEAGYAFDFEKKELKKIDNEEVNGEDYGIDSLYHAQRILEKTLGKVDGYQTDDGILSHKCAITAVKKLYEQKPAEWSEEDVYNSKLILSTISQDQDLSLETKNKLSSWFKFLKNRVYPKQEWSKEDE